MNCDSILWIRGVVEFSVFMICLWMLRWVCLCGLRSTDCEWYSFSAFRFGILIVLFVEGWVSWDYGC